MYLAFERPTPTERQLIRDALLLGEAGDMDVFAVGDGVWTAAVNTPTGLVYVEAGSAAAVLRELAWVLEES